ncbi:MAG: hypothetical protein LQ349_000646 [Xanthoria aureola]|nr:MAG: hypothetical protein LQ349_000646 [Xanthoria aureola]
MLQGISLNHLPLTFQHAILITRNLGYRYIWIDSLCIIQDDVDDWAFESTTMSRIYSNSVLTIAALWGENSHAGCYVERNPLTTEDCYIGEWKHGEVVVTSGDVRRGSTLGNLGPTPLLHRAWVVQERFLSPRTLYFGPWELFWECGEQTSRERWPEISFPRWDDVAIKQRFRNIPGLDLNKSHRKPELESIYKIWTAIRANYWSSQLTYHSDSLVAISGITTWIQERSGLQFVSGLCKNFFLRELLWKVENNFVTSRSTLGPTWSWASVKGAKIKGFHQPSITSKTHTIHTRLESIDDLFSMNEGHQLKDIHLRGPLLHGTLKRDEYGFFVTDDYRLQNFNYDLDIPLPDTVEIVCLVLAESNRDAEAIISAPDAGLILVPDSYESSTYQRVGMWSHPSFKRPGGILAEPADWQSIRLV